MMIPFAIQLSAAVFFVGSTSELVVAQSDEKTMMDACTLCAGGEPVRSPDKLLDVPMLGLKTCAEIEDTVTMYGLTQASELCSVVQSLGSECGCPIPEGACRLCHDGSPVPFPDRLLGGLFLNEFFSAVPASDELMSCDMLEGVLLSMDGESTICIGSQLEFAELCGCPSAPPLREEDNEKDQNQKVTTETPSEKPQSQSLGQCTVCQNGEEIGLPNRTLDVEGFPVDSCSSLDSFAANLSPDSMGCVGARGLGTHCGCPVPENPACSLCPDGKRVKYPDRKIDWFTDGTYGSGSVPDYLMAFTEDLTCGLLESFLHSFAADDMIGGLDLSGACVAVQFQASICGCDPYWKDILLVWSYRVSGFLSLMGSSLILYDVLSDAKKRSNTYSQLMVGVSSFDMISSLAYVLTGVVLPASSGFYSAIGNDATCKMQAFMIQLGQTSVFYNLVLSIYYLLVVKYNWREFQFERLRRYVHGTLVVVGLAMAFGAFPFYGHQIETCKVTFPPLAESHIPNAFFVTIPLALTLLVLGATTTIVCYTVYRQEKRALRWSMTRDNLKMTKKVVRQSVLYVVIFYITLTFQFGSHYVAYTKDYHYWVLFWAKAWCAPAQGFFNAFVYTYRAKGDKLFSCGWLCGCFRSFCGRPSKEKKDFTGRTKRTTLMSSTMSASVPTHHSNVESAHVEQDQQAEGPPSENLPPLENKVQEPEWPLEPSDAEEIGGAEINDSPSQEAAEEKTKMSFSEQSCFSSLEGESDDGDGDVPDDDMFSAAAELWLVSQEQVNYPRLRRG